ncbi:hypothetical protein F5Y16DRAFT_353400 [Xylariaceae sp. FL0255]|nr:hypothetical protein F5Y16DRAFT_353400 [Xylariaceae sp. FL0255]
MLSFTGLPPELQRLCTSYLYADTITLKNLRLVSRAGAIAATERLFESVTLEFSIESAEKFENILQSDSLRSFVKVVVIDASRDETNLPYGFDDMKLCPRKRGWVTAEWTLALSGLFNLSALRQIHIKFSEVYSFYAMSEDRSARPTLQNCRYREFYLNMLFLALYRMPSVNTIGIEHMPVTLADEAPHKSILQRLRGLNLNFVTDPTWEPNYNSDDDDDDDDEINLDNFEIFDPSAHLCLMSYVLSG